MTNNTAVSKGIFSFDNIKAFIKKESVLSVAVVLAVVSSFIYTPKIEYIDFRVLALLFNLMAVVAAYKKLKVMDFMAVSILQRCSGFRAVSAALVFITFFASMIMTNDVALITFVPLSIIVAKKADINPIKTIVIQTLAANLGSCFTPIGNPQNLYIYSYYKIPAVTFFSVTGVIIAVSVVFLGLMVSFMKNKKIDIEFKNIKPESMKDVRVFTVLFIAIILSVFNVIDYKAMFIITVLTVFIMDKKLFSDIDYSLLITFIGFFIFIGNISSSHQIRHFMNSLLGSPESTYFISILSSQFISNVPATMLLSGFTEHYRELLLGVNIGGMGTLIASLASVISYKVFTEEYPEKTGEYMKSFIIYNVLGLCIFVPLAYFVMVV